jgi:hypothetical protein
MTTPYQASKTLRHLQLELAKARKTLRTLSHARLANHPRVTADILAGAAVEVARLENATAAARVAAMTPANPS